MLGCRGRGLTVLMVALLAGACTPRKHGPSKEFLDNVHRIQEDAGKAVKEGIQRETVSPEEEAAKRAARTMQLKPGEPLWVETGKSRILTFDYPVRRVAIGDPGLASIVVLGPYSIMINAHAAGGTGGGAEGAPAGGGVSINMGGLVGGTTSSVGALPGLPHVAETTLAIWGNGGPDVHTLTVADFIDEQVLLEVIVAEIDRSALEQHGIDFRILQNDFFAASYLGGGGGTIPGQIFPSIPLLPLTFGQDAPTYAFVLPNEDAAAFIKALEQEGLASVLAQPKLLAMSGQNAVFQAGGEIPIRIATGFTAAVQFKPFGTIVSFVPRVSEDGDIMLTVAPEVSAPDFSNEVEGIPTFRTRRASTSTRLRNGQTLVIGGLLQNIRQEQVSGVPYLKDIPILGYAFRFTKYANDVLDLMVIVKPQLVRALPPGTQLPLPTDVGPLRTEDSRTKPAPDSPTRPRLWGLP